MRQRIMQPVAPPGRVGVAATALAAGAVAALPTWLGWSTPAFLLYGVTLGVLAVHDAVTQLIPNRILYPAAGASAGLLTAAALVDGGPLGRAVLAAFAVFGGLLALAVLNPAGLGMGDVKLGALIGLFAGWIGWSAVMWVVVVGMGVAGVFGIVQKRRGGSSTVPLGPFLAGAALIVPVVQCGVGGCS